MKVSVIVIVKSKFTFPHNQKKFNFRIRSQKPELRKKFIFSIRSRVSILLNS
jgi:hypothetical protein